jgi:hypothetical protein
MNYPGLGPAPDGIIPTRSGTPGWMTRRAVEPNFRHLGPSSAQRTVFLRSPHRRTLRLVKFQAGYQPILDCVEPFRRLATKTSIRSMMLP